MVLIPNVEYAIIHPCVNVVKVLPEMPLPDVSPYHVIYCVNCFIDSIPNVLAFLAPPPTVIKVQQDPCVPSPCGPNSQCHNINGNPSCACLVSYIGAPPNCRPECSISAECPSNKACIREKCIDPCPGSCGFRALCNVVNHTPICTCPAGFTGDAFTSCQPVPPQQAERKFFLFIKLLRVNK